MNDFFSNVVELLDIPEDNDTITNSEGIVDPIEKAILRYCHHPSILKIKETHNNYGRFPLNYTTVETVSDIVSNLNVKKATPKEGIPTKLLKENSYILSPILCTTFNNGVNNHTFPHLLKIAEIKPTFKKDDRCCKENYRPVSLLPVVSKIYEKILYSQIDSLGRYH